LYLQRAGHDNDDEPAVHKWRLKEIGRVVYKLILDLPVQASSGVVILGKLFRNWVKRQRIWGTQYWSAVSYDRRDNSLGVLRPSFEQQNR